MMVFDDEQIRILAREAQEVLAKLSGRLGEPVRRTPLRYEDVIRRWREHQNQERNSLLS